jgi:hypothetical protein
MKYKLAVKQISNKCKFEFVSRTEIIVVVMKVFVKIILKLNVLFF